LKRLITPNVLIPVLLTIIVLLISILVAKASEKLTFREVAIGVALTICIFLMLAGLVLVFESKLHQVELQMLLGRLKELIPPPDFPWLFSDADLAKAESNTSGDSIWIISPDLSNITQKSVIIDAVKKNIEKRITYTYIVPNSNRVKGVLPRLEQVFGRHSNQLRLIKLPESRFRQIAVTHIAVLNASMASDLPMEVFLELPIEEAGKKIRGYWIKVSQDAAIDLVGRFRDAVEGSRS
jgi:hypothetical protein